MKTIGGVVDDGSFRRSGKTGKRKAEKKLEEAQKAQSQLISLVDKAAKKNLIHKNAAGRKKSRTANLLKKAAGTPAA